MVCHLKSPVNDLIRHPVTFQLLTPSAESFRVLRHHHLNPPGWPSRQAVDFDWPSLDSQVQAIPSLSGTLNMHSIVSREDLTLVQRDQKRKPVGSGYESLFWCKLINKCSLLICSFLKLIWLSSRIINILLAWIPKLNTHQKYINCPNLACVKSNI